MSGEVDQIKVTMAQRAAMLFLKQMSGVPADVQLMAVQMLAQTIFITSVKKDKRLQLLTRWSQSIRNEVLKAGKETKNDA